MKTALITGANRGLGRGFVEYFLSQGFMVFAGVRDKTKLPEDFPKDESLTIVQLDVSSDHSIESAYHDVSSKVDHLDFLVNNAGLNKDSATNGHNELVSNLSDLKRQELLEMFNVNTISPILIVKRFLPLLRLNPSFVINISSCRSSTKDEFPITSANYGYKASKAALNMMTLCSVLDLPSNIKTFAVHPGSVKTHMNPKGVQTPREQVEKIIKIANNWDDSLNGHFLRYDGSLYPL